MACQRMLEAAEVLKSNIERLSQGMGDAPQSHSHRQLGVIVGVVVGVCLQSHSLDRWLRSPSRFLTREEGDLPGTRG